MGGMKGFAWNCGGLRRHTASTFPKVMFFEKTFKNNFDFFFFLETHHKDVNDIPNELLRYQDTHHIVHTQTDTTDTHTGIIGLVKNKYDISDIENIMQGRILRLKITDTSTRSSHRISIVYFPTNQNMDNDFMQQIVRKLRSNDESYFILGDFNFIDHPKDKKNGLGQKDKQLNKIWVPFLEEMEMVDPFREQNPNRKLWSFLGTGVAGNSRIDRIYVKSLNMKNVTSIKYIHTPFHGHRVLSFCINNESEWGQSYYKLNTSLFEDKEYDRLVDEAIAEVGMLNGRTYRQKWEVFLMVMKTKSIRYSTQRNYVKRRLKNELIRQISAIESDEHQFHLVEHYEYLKGRLKEIEQKEIEGYIRRVKFLAPYEKSEPDIAFYSKLENQKKTNDRISQLAESKDGEIFTDNKNILRIATTFYTKLFTSDKVNEKVQHRLLNNVKTKLSKEAKIDLDKPITAEEVKEAIDKLPLGKSPGLDGFPVEFYKEYWGKIKNLFMAYINEVRNQGLSDSRNVSVIKLIYKKTGEIFLLTYYRPISLINVDVKIITKILAERLKFVLPSILHATQTAVYGRRIDHNIHMVRDLIEMANKNDETAAFIFLDQEKAFDRVNHKFLFKTMEAFGIGENFINWVRSIYSNASSMVTINGFFSERIPLKRGVRQGCPLSALLYVLIIEILAIQLRTNPNIVGFTVGGTKIVSAHYMDDTTIIIKQNRCFKEVIKELELYEQATEAKVNYKKTKGLWVGSWKGRRTSPIPSIRWTSGDLKNLGIYFGNENPALRTFEEIVPKFQKRLSYWKQFSLSKLGKATVAEMFLASKLVYAMKFHPIPQRFQKEIQDSIFNFINFPNKVTTVGQKEMHKIKVNGGCKVVNVQVKSETSKAKWLMELATNPNLKVNLDIFTELIGTQKGNNSGRDLFFKHTPYITRVANIESQFYKEALKSVSIFDTKKAIPEVSAWDEENIFYNPLITSKSENTLRETEYFKKKCIYTLGQLLNESSKENRNLPFDKKITSLLNHIVLDTDVKKDDMVYLGDTREIKMSMITQKDLYEDAILKTYSQDHSYSAKWVQKLDTVIIWEEVWNTVHHPYLTNTTKTAIWEQIHLNFYTQYSYNKWHDKNDPCSLCNRIPESIYHIMLHCDYANNAWTRLTPVLSKLNSKPVTEEEKALGIVHIKPTIGIRLRNWLTYKLREQILHFEKIGYHCASAITPKCFKASFNRSVTEEITSLMHRFNNEGKLQIFEKIFGFGNVLFDTIQEGEYRIKKVLP